MSVNAIGVVDLDSNLLIADLKNMNKRVSSTRYTMNPTNPRAVIQSYARPSGQFINLVDESTLGAFTGAQIDAINSYKESGEEVVLKHHVGSWNVIVVEVSVTPSIPYNNPINTDRYYGRITMQILSWK